jgi:hypothetical protein
VPPHQSQVTEQVLAVFGVDLNPRLAVLRNQRAVGEISDVREQVRPLRGEQTDEIHSFGLPFQNGRRR